MITRNFLDWGEVRPVSRMVVFSVTFDRFSVTTEANRPKLGGNSN